MKTFGVILIIVGFFVGCTGITMDTSVEVPTSSDNIYSTPNRVNNLGLMQTQQNSLMISGFMIISGILLVVFSGKKDKSKDETIHKYEEFEEKAKRAEYKGQSQEAIDLYLDSLYHLENDYKRLSKDADDIRLGKILELKNKVRELRGEEQLQVVKKVSSKPFYVKEKEKKQHRSIIIIYIIVLILIILSVANTYFSKKY